MEIGTRVIPPGQTDVYEIVGVDPATGNYNLKKVPVDTHTGAGFMERFNASMAGWDRDSQLEAWRRKYGEENVRVDPGGNIEILDTAAKRWMRVDEEDVTLRDFLADPAGVTVPLGSALAIGAATGGFGGLSALQGLGAKIAYSASIGAASEAVRQGWAEAANVQDKPLGEIVGDVAKEGAVFGAFDLGFAGLGKGLKAIGSKVGPFAAKVLAGADEEMLSKMMGEIGPVIQHYVGKKPGETWLEVGKTMKEDLRQASNNFREQLVSFRDRVMSSDIGGKPLADLPIAGKYEIPKIGGDLLETAERKIVQDMGTVPSSARKALNALKSIRKRKTLGDLLEARMTMDEGLSSLLAQRTEIGANLNGVRSEINNTIVNVLDDVFPGGKVGARWKELSAEYGDKYVKAKALADELEGGVLESDMIKVIGNRYGAGTGASEASIEETRNLLVESGVGDRSIRMAEAADLADYFRMFGAYKGETPIGRYAGPAEAAKISRLASAAYGAAAGGVAGSAAGGPVGGLLGGVVGGAGLFAATRPKVIGKIARGIGARRGILQVPEDIAEAMGTKFAPSGFERAARMVTKDGGQVVFSPHGAVSRPSAEAFKAMGVKPPKLTAFDKLNEIVALPNDSMAARIKQENAATIRKIADILKIESKDVKPSELRQAIIDKVSAVPASEAEVTSRKAAEATAERESILAAREEPAIEAAATEVAPKAAEEVAAETPMEAAKQEAKKIIEESTGAKNIPDPESIVATVPLDVPPLRDSQIYRAAKKTLRGKLRSFKIKIADNVEYKGDIVPAKIVGNTVHINRNMVGSTEDVQSLVVHEIIGHRGVNAFLRGGKIKKVLDRVKKSFPDRVKTAIDAGAESADVAAEEVIAELATESLKKGAVPSGAKRLLEEIKSFFRELTGKPINETDLMILLDYSRKVETNEYIKRTVPWKYAARLLAQKTITGD